MFEDPRSNNGPPDDRAAVAVVGMACRFPQAPDLDTLWANLERGRNAVSEIPGSRWDWRDHYGDPRHDGTKTNSRWGGFIDDVDAFDPLFFRLSPKEACAIDPQQRLALQTAWHAIENAGVAPAALSGRRVGVYVGVSKNDYAELMRARGVPITSHVSTGTVHSIIANRISYVLNLRGRSEVVDTACSSALVALHSAIRDLRSGECEAALVGGVNALLSPTMFISHGQSGMLSSHGRCASFDHRADGYVRAEGVGFVLLEPLDVALRDRSPIVGVIRGSAVNHGGRANSLTAPRVAAQAEVIAAAHADAGVGPSSVHYVEAHGTGTPLGDPIEIAALQKVFSASETPCGVGSVKTNVGHLESASGMAGLFKVLLALRHRRIPGQLHFERLNPHIELDGGPLYLVTEARDWPGEGPHRAGVSAFGMGGVNAHVVVEQAPPHDDAPEMGGDRVIPISARSEGALRRRVQQLIEHLAGRSDRRAARLSDVAHTLQLGRQPMAHRVAFVVHSIAELRQRLGEYVDPAACPERAWSDRARRTPGPALVADASNQELVARRWVEGAEVDWGELAGGRRIPLPVYPFERRRCWFEDSAASSRSEALEVSEAPERPEDSERPEALERSEDSERPEALERSEEPERPEPVALPRTFSINSSDPWARDHVVDHHAILPGVAYLGIAEVLAGRSVPALDDVYWLAPLDVSAGARLRLRWDDDERRRFSLLDGDERAHMTGTVSVRPPSAPPPLELDSVEARCSRRLDPAAIYERLREHGLDYGPSFRVITEARLGHDELLCRLRLRAGSGEASRLTWEPAMLDGLFQAVVVMQRFGGESGPQRVPYHLDRVSVFGTSCAECIGHVYTNDRGGFDMDLYDLQGSPRVAFRGLSKRALRPEPGPACLDYYEARWVHQPLTMHRERPLGSVLVGWPDASLGSFRAHTDIRELVRVEPGSRFDRRSRGSYRVDPRDRSSWAQLWAALDEDQLRVDSMVIWAPDVRAGVDETVATGVLSLLALVQASILARAEHPLRLLYVYGADGSVSACLHGMVGGLARTLAYENPKIELVTLGLDQAAQADAARIVSRELSHHVHPPLGEVAIRKGIREVRVVEPAAVTAARRRSWSDGAYLVTGGAGVLGSVFAEYLAREAGGTVVLVGRSAPGERSAKVLAALQEAGAPGLYVQADVARPDHVERLFAEVERRELPVRGIIHAAGSIEDGFVLNKDADSFLRVLAPKVQGLVNLDLASRGHPLDFFVTCSSVAALMPNQGQGDYATGNSFMDAFCARRNALRARGERQGRAISIAWPLWAQGGIRVGEREQEHLRSAFGMRPISHAEGIEVLTTLLALEDPPSHCLAIAGDRAKIERSLSVTRGWPEALDAQAVESGVWSLVSRVGVGVGASGDDELDPESTFSDLGLDSLALVRLADSLDRRYDVALRPSVFFEHQTVPTLAAHLVERGATTPAVRSRRAMIDECVEGSVYRKVLHNDEFFMRDHVVEGEYNVPGACFVEAGLQAFEAAYPQLVAHRLVDNYWVRKLSSSGPAIDMRMGLRARGEGAAGYEIRDGESGLVHAMGEIYGVPPEVIERLCWDPLPIDRLRARATHRRGPKDVYPRIIAEGLHVGPSFMPIVELWLSDGEALAHLRLPEPVGGTLDDYALHPTMLTGVLQAALLANKPHGIEDTRYIPIAIDEIVLRRSLPRECAVHVTVHEQNRTSEDVRKFDAVVATLEGEVVVRMRGVSLRKLAPATAATAAGQPAAPRPAVAHAASPAADVPALDRIAAFLIEICAEGIGLEVEEIGADVGFEDFGIDSVVVVELNRRLEAVFGRLSKTLLFEHRSFAELAAYFSRVHAAKLRERLGEAPVLAPAPAPQLETAPMPEAGPEPVTRMLARRPVHDDQIAIVGVAGRYPGATDVGALWQRLLEGHDAIEPFPAERIGSGPGTAPASAPARWGSFIDGIDRFDALFFKIPPRQAEQLDPQERLFLEVVWETLEHAGYSPERLTARSKKVGVFVGALWQPYIELGVEQSARGHEIGPSGLLYNIPNRVSYFFDWIGPSLAIDTACSGSLTALHYACTSLRIGESDHAVAGGVNLSLGASKYRFLRDNGFLASDGRCRSFGAGGDGYVPGEGVGAVLLKRLGDAQRDGDRILAVIGATSVNHGGKTHGFTVPNPNQQAALIEEALTRAEIHPRAVGYVEAHGTGTSLGDPIEITGLCRVFEAQTSDRQFCRIGSLKSNIGHLEAAAGIAGLTKILLQLEHQTLVPSLHAESLNPNIDFEASPFEVQTRVTPWPKPEVTLDDGSTPSLRTALLSSFGAGGSNGHAVIQEYEAVAPASEQTAAEATLDRIVPLSAKDAATLARLVARLADHLEQLRPDRRPALADVAYTLQRGRAVFEHRVAFVADDLNGLLRQLRAFEASPTSTTSAGLLSLFDDDLLQATRAWIAKGKARSLAQLWSAGSPVDWVALRGDRPGRLVTLPSYPFAHTRHWLPPSSSWASPASSAATTGRLHPLVHRNVSTLGRCRFESSFDLEAFFVGGHRIDDRAVVPGVAQMAMVLAAAERALDRPARILEDVVFSSPLGSAAGPVQASLELSEDRRGITFEIRDEQGVRSSHGRVVTEELDPRPGPSLAELERPAAPSIVADAVYERLESLGMGFGPGMRSVTALSELDAGVLAQVERPASAALAVGFNPSLFDAVFQVTGWICARDEGALWIPFELGRVEFHAPIPTRCLALVSPRADGGHGQSVRRFDAWLVDPDGHVVVRIEDIALRSAGLSTPTSTSSLTMATPVWVEAPRPEIMGARPAATLVVVELPVDRAGTKDRWIPLPSLDSRPAEALEQLSGRLLRMLQPMLAAGGEPRVVLALPEHHTELAAAASGMLRSLAIEYPAFRAKVVRLSPACHPALGELLAAEASDFTAVDVRLDGSARWVRGWERLPTEVSRGAHELRAGGVYWIAGGLGQLGRRLAFHVADRVPRARIVLCGRSEASAEAERVLDELRARGATASYSRCDLADAQQVYRLAERIRREHGAIHGVFHVAGVSRDGLLRSKTEARLGEVFDPKVRGTVNLDAATQDDELDGFVCFSSIAGVAGNLGQCDYAAANGFQDAFVERRRELVAQGRRRGRSLAIAWPLWAEGGMQVPDPERLLEQMGITPMPTDVGLAALTDLLSLERSRVLVAHGPDRRIRQKLAADFVGIPARVEVPTGIAAVPVEARGELAPQLIATLQGILTGLTKLPASAIDPAVTMSEYGIESVMLARFASEISRAFDIDVTPTMFFEHTSLSAASTHLLAAHSESIEAYYAVAARGGAVAQQRAEPAEAAGPGISVEDRSYDSAIAIVGMSGQFPGSPDLETLWTNLLEGRDLITEIPRERWNWRDHGQASGRGSADARVRWGGFVDGIDAFDAEFFRISPREASLMDPQHRKWLEVVWNCLEDAGIRPSELAGTETGVFVGVANHDHAERLALSGADVLAQTATGNTFSMLANRVSYLLDLRGPSEPVDTACSSSLVAIDRGVRAIQSGRCDAAIVGGVNALLCPTFHRAFSRAGMLSPDGRCKAFDRRADGYVRSEGFGAVLLKPLARAEADSDHIYGVIRGTSVNHNGRVQSLTAPDPGAQMRLILDAHRQAGVDPRAVGSIEAHGTGTSLGDPVELDGLQRAFGALYERWGLEPASQPHCGLGSIKSNIGHSESAAGIAGLCKVLLSLQHGVLLPTLHLCDRNPYIDLEGTPFHFVTEPTPWTTFNGAPRCAGISAFGFGGVNAHVVVEEYRPPSTPAPRPRTRCIVLSARTEAQLEARVVRLARAVASLDAGDFGRLAYTLQIGREAMEHRIAFVAEDLDALRDQLHAWGRQEHVPGCVRGRPDPSRPPLTGDALAQHVTRWAADGQIDRIAAAWVAGADVEWRRLHPGPAPRRLPLPGYPFADQRFALPPLPRPRSGADGGERHAVTLSDGQFDWSQHRLHGRAVLPAVAYLDLARQALERHEPHEEGRAFHLQQVRWQRPLWTDADTSISVDVEERRVSISSGSGGEPVVHMVVRLGDPVTPDARRDLMALRSRCSRPIRVESLYRVLEEGGLTYGESYRSMVDGWAGEEGTDEALVRLVARGALGCGPDPLDVSMLDGLLQASSALFEGDSRGLVPHAARRIVLYRSIDRGFAHLVRVGPRHRRVLTFDATLIAEDGRVSAVFEGVEVRPFLATDQESVWRGVRRWSATPVVPVRRSTEAVHFLTPAFDAEAERLGLETDVLSRARLLPDLRGDLGQVTQIVFDELRRALLRRERTIVWCVPEDALGVAPLTGLFRTAHLEDPDRFASIVTIEDLEAIDRSALARIAAQESRARGPAEVRYRGGVRHALAFEALAVPAVNPRPLRPGVYWITGGMGGLGMHFARHLGRHAGVRILLSGRRPEAEIHERLRALQHEGLDVHYRSVDVTSPAATRDAMGWIDSTLGPLRGLLHAAGCLRDSLLPRKTRADVAAVFDPKIGGVLALDRVTQDAPLDFMVLFSSVAGSTGNVGQAAYAGANAFLDAFAVHRNRQVSEGTRHGRTISIAWPLWSDGGMTSSASPSDSVGLVPIEVEAGLQAFDQALAAGIAHQIVAAEPLSEVAPSIGPATSAAPEPALEGAAADPVAASGLGGLDEGTETHLTAIASQVLGLPPDRLEPTANLERYGVDSMMQVEIVSRLERDLGPLSKTLLFEFTTIREIAGYLLEHKRAPLVSLLGTSSVPAPRLATPGPTTLPCGCCSEDGDESSRTTARHRYQDAYLRDHVFEGQRVVLGLTHATLLASDHLGRERSAAVRIDALRYAEVIALGPGEAVELRVDAAHGHHRVEFSKGSDWRPTARAEVGPATDAPDPWAMPNDLRPYRPLQRAYSALDGFSLGPSYRVVDRLESRDADSVAHASLRTDDAPLGSTLDPRLLNAAYVAIAPQLEAAFERIRCLPTYIDHLWLSGRAPRSCVVHTRVVQSGPEAIVFDATFSEGEQIVARMLGCRLRVLDAEERSRPRPLLPSRAIDRVESGDIAVIGMSGRFGGARDLGAFWQNLREGREVIGEIPRARVEGTIRVDTGAEDQATRWGSFVEGVDEFDEAFFGISPREARWMDPQLRLLLQSIYHTSEDAGVITRLRGTDTGVFVGSCFRDYMDRIQSLGGPINPYVGTGNSPATLANRVSFTFDLRGPSLPIDTACSSSLFALDAAVDALHRGSCTMAFVAGVNIICAPFRHRYFSKIGALSTSGRCHSFDAAADGYVPGEAVVSVLLKPLSRAIADGDPIHGVIKGCAAAHGGYTPSLTAPSVKGEARVIASAWQRSRVDPRSLDYIEAHGTGTPLGDPIEVRALARAFEATGGKPSGCILGSAKAHIGHAEGAAGLTGVVKVLLQMRHEHIPAMPGFRKLNPQVDLEDAGLRINEQGEPWPRAEGPRRAGVSSFGFSGAYAHVVLEDYRSPRREPRRRGEGSPLIPLSAKTPEALRAAARRLADFLRAEPRSLADVAYTLQSGRDAHPHRQVVKADDEATLLEGLEVVAREPGAVPYCEQRRRLPDELASELVDRPRWGRIAQAWLDGYDIPWEQLRPAHARRIHLPGYAFARHRHWLPEDPSHGEGAGDESVTYDGSASEGAVGEGAAGEGHGRDGDRDHTPLVELLRRQLATLTEIPIDRIEPDVEVTSFGLDSIVIAELTARLEPVLGGREPAIFFAARTIRDAARQLQRRFPDHRADASPATPSAEVATVHAGSTPSLAVAQEQSAAADVAIIGISGRYPHASDVFEFAEILRQGLDCIEDAPATHQSVGGRPRWGGFVSDPMCFDYGHFNMSYRDALIAHPEERLLLQEAWRCFESAGYDPLQWVGTEGADMGVYVGASFNDYPHVVSEANEGDKGDEGDVPHSSQIFTYANRLSYFFNLVGPSVVVDSACSSSLYSIFDAYNAIRFGLCELALAGGVNLSLHRSKYDFLEAHNFLAEDGRCRAFVEGGSGYVPGEGVGLVLLKRLDRALEDRDNVLAVIKGAAAGNDGRTHGFTVPNPDAQRSTITEAMRVARVDPRTISCVECHGTGTALGDPIEISALADAFGRATPAESTCAVSSVKSNIGHLEAAAGIAQLTKMVLQLQAKERFPNVMHHERLNPNIAFGSTPFSVQTERAPWRLGPGQAVRRGGISSFGAGGTNVHVVVEEAPPSPCSSSDPGARYVVPFSAPSPEQLRAMVERTVEVLDHHGTNLGVRNIAATLQRGRVHQRHRLAVVCGDSMPALLDKLRAYTTGRAEPGIESDVLLGDAEDPARIGSLAGSRRVPVEPRQAAHAWVHGLLTDFAPDPGATSVFLPGHVFRRDEVSPTVARPSSSSKSVAGQTSLELVRGALERVLGALPAAYDDRMDFATLGVDSITTARLHEALGSTFPELELFTLFEMDTALRLSAHLDGLKRAHPATPAVTEAGDPVDPLPSGAEPVEVGDIDTLEFGERQIPIQRYIEAYRAWGKGTHDLSVVDLPVEGANLECVVCGEGPTVVLLPPFNSTAIIWIRQLIRLSRHFRLVVPHYPGLGNSDWVEGLDRFEDLAGRMAGMVEALVDRGTIPTTRVHWVGWSLGGFLAQTISARYPQYVATLVLVSTTTISWSSSEYSISGEEFALQCAREFEQNFHRLPKFLRTMPEIEALRRQDHPERFVVGTTDRRVINRYFRMIARFRNVDAASRVKAPTLLISGSDDILMPARFARELGEKIPGSKYQEIRGGRHFLSLFEAKAINRALRKWLRD